MTKHTSENLAFLSKIKLVRIPNTKLKFGKYPVTQSLYQAVTGTNPSYFKHNPLNPVENVGWEDAQSFCEKLSQLTGKNYRLPTNFEWEYACRAGTTTNYYFGDDDNQLKDYAWYDENSRDKTHPVGEKLPNNWGIYDMHGNVWEWTQEGCLRGGCWNDIPYLCSSGIRNCLGIRRNIRYYENGFRVVCQKSTIISYQ